MNRKYTNKFIYIENTRYPKTWWVPFYRLGRLLQIFIYRIHNIFGKKRTLTEYDYRQAKELANERVSEQEYLRRFSSINPYAQKKWATVLWWIRNNLTLD